MRKKVSFTLDVLSDGSEYTGTTIFLSVWKRPSSIIGSSSAGGGCSGTSTSEWLREEMRTGTAPLARYALSGLGDAASRLCADQRSKLSPTRAVFLLPPCDDNDDDDGDDDASSPSSSPPSPSSSSHDGIASLLLALHSSGAASLHVVTASTQTNEDTIEEIASIILGNYRHLNIRTCRIPITMTTTTPTSSGNEGVGGGGEGGEGGGGGGGGEWWNVYHDEYLTVHATQQQQQRQQQRKRQRQRQGHSSSFAVYLYSIHMEVDKVFTIALLSSVSTSSLLSLRKDKLPLLISEEESPSSSPSVTRTTAVSVDCILALDPNERERELLRGQDIPVWTTRPTTATTSDADSSIDIIDPGLLIRSRQVGNYFSDNMPWAFPPSTTTTMMKKLKEEEERLLNPKKMISNPSFVVLRSCTSLVLLSSSSKEEEEGSLELLLDRRTDIWKRSSVDDDGWSTTLESLKILVPRRRKGGDDENEILLEEEDEDDEDDDNGDENEILLDDDNDDDDDDGNDDENEISPDGDDVNDNHRGEDTAKLGMHLVVLGTGCASPSAIRGASGYALVIPPPAPSSSSSFATDVGNNGQDGNGNNNNNDDKEEEEEIYLLDCGEGVTTMLYRTCAHIDWKHNIRGIWISHAHLDHYGGLARLLQVIANHRRATTTKDARPCKRPRLAETRTSNSSIAPWVMAPPKVIRYIDVLLGCRHGLSLTDPSIRMFHPLLHHDPTTPPGPWACFHNIKVYHNCCPSYGLLLRCKHDDDDDGENRWLCYSGDTRPCTALVRACKRFIPRNNCNNNNNNQKLLMIHEATFEDSDRANALEKKHSTISEAIGVAREVSASRVLLTHFSQRYISVGKETNDACNQQQQQQQQQQYGTGGRVMPMGFAMDGLRISL